jgi:UPF0755 protein
MNPKQILTVGPSLKKFRLFVLVMVIIVLAAGGLAFAGYTYIMQPNNPEDDTLVDIVIPKGQSLSKTAAVLHEKGLLRSPVSLKILAYTKDAKIQAGRFKVAPNMTPAEIIETLNTGKLDYWVTFLEGWRREEFAQSLAKASADNNIDFDKQQFLDLTQEKEGYLFPDSYLFPMDASTTMIVSSLENTLDKKISTEMEQQISASGRTKHQILTMASLIEREARTDTARKMVSGILWKRLDNGWPLQVDATLQFAKASKANNVTDWWAEPLAVDKQINSPYNTYQNTGLPPGPICAPSASSINAAVYPQASEYWYYISDLEGNMHYAKDLSEHNANVNRYLR